VLTGGGTILLACDDGRPVGLISCHPVPLLAEGGAFVRITALAVAAEHQGKGIGRRLVEEVERLAVGWDAMTVEVSSGKKPAREAAHQFYPALRYRSASVESVVYRKTLAHM